MFEDWAWAALLSAVWTTGAHPIAVPGGWWVSAPNAPAYFLLKGEAPRHPALSTVEPEHRVTVDTEQEIVWMDDVLRTRLEPCLKRQKVGLRVRSLPR